MKKEKTNDNTNITSNSKQLTILKNNFPQCFDKNGDFISHKMREIVAKDDINLSKESYNLNWLGKSYARLLANEPPLTLLKADNEHNQKPENQNSGNLLIKGDNLEVLKHLRYAYSEQVKMIYIDPPYNTGGDGFVYQDNRKFTKEQLSQLAGIEEDEALRILDFTARKSNSHSAWLTFIYPRLYIARELLSDDGVIFISIDDNEQAQLKLLCDEIFGEDNFVGDFVWNSKITGGHDANNINSVHEYILTYSKNCENSSVINGQISNKKYPNIDEKTKKQFKWDSLWTVSHGYTKNCDYPIFDELNNTEIHPYMCHKDTKNVKGVARWYWSYDTYLKDKDELLIKNRKVYKKVFSGTKIAPDSLLLSKQVVGGTSLGKSRVKELFRSIGIFDNPKPCELIKHIANFLVDKNDTILDFFAGSGTTADAVMQLNAEDGGNRKCISIQIDETIDPKKNKIAYDFVKNELSIDSPTIFDITKERILRAAKKLKGLSEQDLGFKVFEVLPMFEGYFNEMNELENEQQTLFDGTLLSDNDLSILLSTWMVSDGIKLNAKTEIITLDKYKAYYADKNLYLMDKGFTTDDLKALIEKLDNVDDENKNFQPNKLVLFGYNFDSKHQREISEVLNNHTNKKQIELDKVIRY